MAKDLDTISFNWARMTVFLLVFTMYAASAYMTVLLDKRQAALACLKKRIARLRQEKLFLQKNAALFHKQQRQLKHLSSRLNVGKCLTQLAKEAGVEDMTFRISSQVASGFLKPKEKMFTAVVDLWAENDTCLADFIEKCAQVFEGQLLPKSLVIGKKRLLKKDDNASLPESVISTYILEWFVPLKCSRKKNFKGVLKEGTIKPAHSNETF